MNGDNDVITYDSPPNSEPGMIRMRLDAKCRLIAPRTFLRAGGAQEENGNGSAGRVARCTACNASSYLPKPSSASVRLTDGHHPVVSDEMWATTRFRSSVERHVLLFKAAAVQAMEVAFTAHTTIR